MAEQSHPPYESGALTTPRQLQRWLDINAQNGPLERTKKTFTLSEFDFGGPPYDIIIPYHGVTQNPCVIGAVFNYTSPNVFSLRVGDTSKIVSLSTVTIVIASKVSTGVLDRYILWQGNPVVPLTIPVYSGQPINKVFRIEIWIGMGNSVDTQITDPNSHLIQTSVRGHEDYRYGLDTSLETLTSTVASTTATDAFGLTLPVNLPMIMPVNTYI